MKSDDATWLAAELGFPCLEESTAGLNANDAALACLDDELPVSLERAAAAIAGASASDPTLARLLAQSRAGERASAVVSGGGVSAQSWRVLAVPAASGYARLTFAPGSVEQAGDVQRRAALVDVAAAVSHEVANAMAAITGWADLAAMPTEESGVDPAEALALIASCARTAQGAARRMLSLARGQEAQDETTDFSELAQEVLDLLTLTARQARVGLSFQIEPDLLVRAARGQLFTVLWNLTKNAIEACPAGGRVEVTVQGDDEHVQLSVRDTGPGLSADERERIFSPYYTTKVNGTGLGLPLVRQTIEALQGSLGVDSAVGSGTTFEVALPRLLRRSATIGGSGVPPVRMQSDEAPRGSQMLDADILVIDDDDALREMLATALSLKGARVTAVGTSAEARALTDRFDIALIDMNLNDCRGDELLAALRVRGTVNAAMLVTGTVQRPRLVPGGEPDDWVRKPFEISQLVDRLKRTLERHAMLSAATATMRF